MIPGFGGFVGILALIGVGIGFPIRVLAYVLGGAFASVTQGFRHGQQVYHTHMCRIPSSELDGWSDFVMQDSEKELLRLGRTR